jgi:hypothetical protein
MRAGRFRRRSQLNPAREVGQHPLVPAQGPVHPATAGQRPGRYRRTTCTGPADGSALAIQPASR